MPSISICIPAYEMGGNGGRFLARSLDALKDQTFKDFEVVVSDQSTDLAVRDVCAEYSGALDIRHIWNRDGARQASSNINHSMDNATGEILKILFQDDFLNGSNALHQIAKAMQGGAKWLLCGSCVTRDGSVLERPMVPRLTGKLQFGRNTVSSPSVLALRRECRLRFDENLIWLMDVEFYKRLWDACGDPVILTDTLVVNRLHSGQVSAGVSKQLRREELRYVRAKFGSSTNFSGRLEYLRQRLKAL